MCKELCHRPAIYSSHRVVPRRLHEEVYSHIGSLLSIRSLVLYWIFPLVLPFFAFYIIKKYNARGDSTKREPAHCIIQACRRFYAQNDLRIEHSNIADGARVKFSPLIVKFSPCLLRGFLHFYNIFFIFTFIKVFFSNCCLYFKFKAVTT